MFTSIVVVQRAVFFSSFASHLKVDSLPPLLCVLLGDVK